MFRIAICEDNAVQRSYEEKLVRTWAQDNQYRVIVDVYSNAEQFLFVSKDRPAYRIMPWMATRWERLDIC